MRFLFALVGLLFDLLVLAVACLAIYCSVQPQFFYDSVNLVTGQFETTAGRIQIIGGAVVLIVLSFRGLFLLAFGRGDSDFVIRRDDRGSLSVSRFTVERLIGSLAGGMTPPAEVLNIRITQNDAGLNLSMKISLDMSNCKLGEYTEKLNETVRAYFKESLGVPVGAINVQASAAASEASASPGGSNGE